MQKRRASVSSLKCVTCVAVAKSLPLLTRVSSCCICKCCIVISPAHELWVSSCGGDVEESWGRVCPSGQLSPSERHSGTSSRCYDRKKHRRSLSRPGNVAEINLLGTLWHLPRGLPCWQQHSHSHVSLNQQEIRHHTLTYTAPRRKLITPSHPRYFTPTLKY